MTDAKPSPEISKTVIATYASELRNAIGRAELYKAFCNVAVQVFGHHEPVYGVPVGDIFGSLAVLLDQKKLQTITPYVSSSEKGELILDRRAFYSTNLLVTCLAALGECDGLAKGKQQRLLTEKTMMQILSIAFPDNVDITTHKKGTSPFRTIAIFMEGVTARNLTAAADAGRQQIMEIIDPTNWSVGKDGRGLLDMSTVLHKYTKAIQDALDGGYFTQLSFHLPHLDEQLYEVTVSLANGGNTTNLKMRTATIHRLTMGGEEYTKEHARSLAFVLQQLSTYLRGTCGSPAVTQAETRFRTNSGTPMTKNLTDFIAGRRETADDGPIVAEQKTGITGLYALKDAQRDESKQEDNKIPLHLTIEALKEQLETILTYVNLTESEHLAMFGTAEENDTEEEEEEEEEEDSSTKVTTPDSDTQQTSAGGSFTTPIRSTDRSWDSEGAGGGGRSRRKDAARNKVPKKMTLDALQRGSAYIRGIFDNIIDICHTMDAQDATALVATHVVNPLICGPDGPHDTLGRRANAAGIQLLNIITGIEQQASGTPQSLLDKVNDTSIGLPTALSLLQGAAKHMKQLADALERSGTTTSVSNDVRTVNGNKTSGSGGNGGKGGNSGSGGKRNKNSKARTACYCCDDPKCPNIKNDEQCPNQADYAKIRSGGQPMCFKCHRFHPIKPSKGVRGANGCQKKRAPKGSPGYTTCAEKFTKSQDDRASNAPATAQAHAVTETGEEATESILQLATQVIQPVVETGAPPPQAELARRTLAAQLVVAEARAALAEATEKAAEEQTEMASRASEQALRTRESTQVTDSEPNEGKGEDDTPETPPAAAPPAAFARQVQANASSRTTLERMLASESKVSHHNEGVYFLGGKRNTMTRQ